jgi:hypothetical protein
VFSEKGNFFKKNIWRVKKSNYLCRPESKGNSSGLDSREGETGKEKDR